MFEGKINLAIKSEAVVYNVPQGKSNSTVFVVVNVALVHSFC